MPLSSEGTAPRERFLSPMSARFASPFKVPDKLKRFGKRWTRFGRAVGNFQARLLLSIFYYVVLFPFALVVRWCSDPLAIKPRSAKGWQHRETDHSSPKDRAMRQS